MTHEADYLWSGGGDDARYAIHQAVKEAAPDAGRILWAKQAFGDKVLVRVRTERDVKLAGPHWTLVGERAAASVPGKPLRFVLEACMAGEHQGSKVARPLGECVERVRGALEGVRLETLDAHEAPLVRFHKKGHVVTLDRKVFFGAGRVEDAAAFDVVRTRGIGRGKAFGLGLIVVI